MTCFCGHFHAFSCAKFYFSEAIKRNPKDARNFLNRSMSYLKLNAPAEALRDAESAIAIDPEFGKAYIRKANALIRMQKTSEAMTALDTAATKDTGA